MSIRSLVPIVIACLLAAVSVLVLPTHAEQPWHEPFSPALLEPGGAQDVGVRSTRLDTGADDPWNPGHARVVMVDVHYPAAAGEHPLRHYARAEYMSELGALAWAPGHEQRLGLAEGQVNWQFVTHSHRWAPPREGRFPAVVVSAPERGMRSSLTALAEELASRGFVVATVDHPYDAPAVELWPTREVIGARDAERELAPSAAREARAADTIAVADRLTALDEEVAQAVAPDCTLVLTGTGGLGPDAAALTDEPMVLAQVRDRYPAVERELGPLPSLAEAEREFRAGVADLRSELVRRLAQNPDCPNHP